MPRKYESNAFKLDMDLLSIQFRKFHTSKSELALELSGCPGSQSDIVGSNVSILPRAKYMDGTITSDITGYRLRRRDGEPDHQHAL